MGHRHPWNVVVSTREGRFEQAQAFLSHLGTVRKTDFFNVLTLEVEEPARFLEEIHAALELDPRPAEWLGRVVPLERQFTFQSPEEFEQKAREAVLPWLPELAGRSFHVRMHRRGFKGRLSSQDEERFLDRFIMDALAQGGSSARVSFEDPDLIIALETVGQEAGLSLWDREQRQRHFLLGLD
jgi:tRNA(Ser,Leu) C12 N-acetylase TAN1